MNTPKNKIKTPGYFVKRLRDNGFIVLKMFNGYGIHDPRRWTVLVDPGGSSVFITCFTNKEFNGDIMFELNDGGVLFNKNYNIQTDSIEVIIKYLIQRGINNKPEKSPYYTQKPKYTSEASQTAQ
ncbi:MAG: hypothetical protein EBU90_03100 [Proteobacteria bacterium]|nr:hypothetical protein [Pseudomonadota bacterium]NBP13313.1 hypothetical protein [bacterium]